MWQTIFSWFIAGCLSLSALNFSGEGKENPLSPSPVEPLNPPLVAPSPLQKAVGAPLEPVSQEGKAKESVEGVKGSLQEISRERLQTPVTGPIQETSEVLEEGEYKVQPEDVLQITVYEEPDLTAKVRVSGNGEISFPLLGRIPVTGLSVLEVQEKITELLAKDYLINPQVVVFIETYHARDVFVTGAVNKPGSYPLPAGKPATLMEAIAMAGGFTEEAALNSTRIIRIEEGKEKTIHVKARDIIKKGEKSEDVEIRPNDVVFIPESFF